ncbi:hypothetical protein BGZ63DRAFT_372870 [Mariannaea sp. PMI_226]|nr:hypothetical protein BGZ63DRAFT_372870 [Mariannaea sp. PMI_226]
MLITRRNHSLFTQRLILSIIIIHPSVVEASKGVFLFACRWLAGDVQMSRREGCVSERTCWVSDKEELSEKRKVTHPTCEPICDPVYHL